MWTSPKDSMIPTDRGWVFLSALAVRSWLLLIHLKCGLFSCRTSCQPASSDFPVRALDEADADEVFQFLHLRTESRLGNVGGIGSRREISILPVNDEIPQLLYRR